MGKRGVMYPHQAGHACFFLPTRFGERGIPNDNTKPVRPSTFPLLRSSPGSSKGVLQASCLLCLKCNNRCQVSIVGFDLSLVRVQLAPNRTYGLTRRHCRVTKHS